MIILEALDATSSDMFWLGFIIFFGGLVVFPLLIVAFFRWLDTFDKEKRKSS